MRNLILVMILALFSRPVAAYAATYYVSTTGSDSNPGTTTQPFRTIGFSVSRLNAGDFLYLMSGVYAESLDSNKMTLRGGTATQPITIAAKPGDEVTLKPSSGIAVINLAHPSIKYVVIDGLKLDGINLVNNATSFGDGVSIYGASYITISNCDIFNAPGNGVITHDSGLNPGDHNRFIKLKVHDNGYENDLRQRVAHGLYIITDFNIIEQSEVYNNYGWGVHIYNSGGGPDYNEVKRCRVFGNGRGPYAPLVAGIILSQGTGNSANNNLVWGNKGAGIAVDYDAVNSRVYNNTSYKNGGPGVSVGSATTGTIVKNNILYLNSSAVLNLGQNTSLSNNLLTDPRFVNAAANDFRLQSGSAGIDNGVAVPVPDDFDGLSRPKGDVYDIGAYEFQSPTGSPPSNLRILTP